MKKRISLLALVFIVLSCEKETLVSTDDLPNEVVDYVSTHFPNHPIIQSIIDKDGFTKTYDILLDGGVSLEFNRKKEIIDIESEFELPSSVIPEKVSTYVTTNYPSNVITDWELDDKNQHVELDNEVELEFNMNGDFLRVDN